MPRPKSDYPTPAELEALQVLWDGGPATVRSVMESLEATRQGRAYTSVMSLLDLMYEKKLVTRRRSGRAFVYTARVDQEKTLGGMVSDLCQRAFDSSAESLVAHLLDQADPSPDELRKIRQTIQQHLNNEERGR